MRQLQFFRDIENVGQRQVRRHFNKPVNCAAWNDQYVPWGELSQIFLIEQMFAVTGKNDAEFDEIVIMRGTVVLLSYKTDEQRKLVGGSLAYHIQLFKVYHKSSNLRSTQYILNPSVLQIIFFAADKKRNFMRILHTFVKAHPPVYKYTKSQKEKLFTR